jgi:hypothetical protein
MRRRTCTLSREPPLRSEEVNDLFAVTLGLSRAAALGAILKRSLVYICAYLGSSLLGFVNVAWDGGTHAFLLNTTGHPDLLQRGIGRRLVLLAADEARECSIQWLHWVSSPTCALSTKAVASGSPRPGF